MSEGTDHDTPRADEPSGDKPSGFHLEIDPDQVEDALRSLRDRIRDSVVAGRYTKVRLSYRGRALGPDLPLAVFLAAEGAAFWLLSPLAALLANLGAKAILDVEFIHEADELVQEGLAAYLEGELELAEARYRQALDKRGDDPCALYNLGTLLRVTDRREEALKVLRIAAMGPEGHPDVRRAAEAVERMSVRKKQL
ncbi:MAG TPA: hypothetical protein ENK18_23250 [Deltaproteobacteria bacterium]|nr:hypothetical protein [Deltaproteobacteria bacterium]